MQRRISSSPWSRIPAHLFDQRLTRNPSIQQTRLYHASNTHRHKQPNTKTTSTAAKTESQHQPISSLPTTSDPDLPHLTTSQKVHMTQIHEKAITHRLATSTCTVWFSNTRPWSLLSKGQHATKKGDVFSVARIAGIMAAKKTPDIVPLCHPGIGITGVEVDVRLVRPDEEKEQVAELGEGEEGKRSGELYALGAGDGGRYGAMRVVATVSCQGRTGVEMEAMTATVSAALTVYDMLKAVDKGMVIGDVKLLEKLGGKSGHWIREKEVEQ